jgi:hypothetical protein
VETATAKETTCTAVHPVTGDVCSKSSVHFFSHNPQVKQHIASNGVKWPSLHELDPAEGYNDFVLYKQ